MNYKLMYVEVPIVNWNTCNESYFLATGVPIGDKNICAGIVGKDACQVFFFTLHLGISNWL